MAKYWTCVGLLGIALALNGCGGGSQGIVEQATGGLALAGYKATLADGTPMVIDFVKEDKGVYTGSFGLVAEKGEHAQESGSFFGTVSGGQLTAECTANDGKKFQLEGAVTGSEGLRLTRSDISGQTLAFSRIPDVQASRSTMSFYLDGLAGTKGQVLLSSTPNSTQTSGSTTIREYKGTWQGVPVIFWSYSNGPANLVVYVDPLCIMSASFSSYQPNEFASKTLTAASGYMTMYNVTLRTQLKFKTLPVASPG